MKLRKILIVFSLFVILLTCIGSICATEDTHFNELSSADHISVDGEKKGLINDFQNSENEVLKIESESESDFSGSNFTSLQSKIDVVSSGSVINLKNNIIQDGNSPIVISKPITINGNGHTIDANQKSGIFSIIQGPVILNNITLINANGTKGGAVYNENCHVTMTNIDFANNTGTSGGAIYNYEQGFVEIRYSNFTNNAGKKCPAIYNLGKMNIEDSIFTRNFGVYMGSAIRNLEGGIITITKCNFTNNYAENGGAITNECKVTISSSYFANNSATYYGGAIYNIFDSETLIRDTCFINNSAEFGGAVHNYGELKIFRSPFSNNTASSNGGAIYNDHYGQLTLDSSVLDNNSAMNGGAIYNSDKIEIDDSIFSNNNAYSRGGVIYNTGNADMLRNELTNNSALNYGGAIYNSNQMGVFWNNFTGNTAENGDHIYNNGYINLYNNTFSDNTISNYSNIYNSSTINKNSNNMVCNKKIIYNSPIFYVSNTSYKNLNLFC